MTDMERVWQAMFAFEAERGATRGKAKDVGDFYDVGGMLQERWEKEEKQRRQQEQKDVFDTPDEVDFDSPLPLELLSKSAAHAQRPLPEHDVTSVVPTLHSTPPKHGRTFQLDARRMQTEDGKDRQELYHALHPTLLRYLQCMPEGAILYIDLKKSYHDTWIILADRLESIRKLQNPVEGTKVHANDLPRRAQWYDYIEDCDAAGRNETETKIILTNPHRSLLKEQATPVVLDPVWAATDEGQKYQSDHVVFLGRGVHVTLAAHAGHAEKRLVILKTF